MERRVIKKAEELREYLKDFGKSFAFDTETTSLKYMELEIEGFSACDGNKAFYIDLINNDDFNYLMEQIGDMINNSTTVVAHNIVYDMKVLHKYGVSFEGKKIYDTMIADHLIDENRLHGLKFLANELLGHDTVKYGEAEKAGHQSDLFYEYAINDAVWTWELMKWQQPIMKEENLVDVFRKIEMPFQFCLLDMEINGMEVDVEGMAKIREQLKESIDNFNEEMHDMIGEQCEYQADLFGNINLIPTVNFASGKVLQDVLFNKLGLEVVETTPSGKPSTGRNTIDRYKNKVPFVSTLNKFKIAQKLLSAYFSEEGQIMRNLDSDNKVRPSFRDTGAATGRLSCSNPNLQQLPKANKDFPVDSRGVFIAGVGRKMIVSDFSGQEICVAAQISEDKTLINAIRNGHDTHLAVANSSFNLGIPDECLSKKHPEYDMYKEKFKKERFNAKCITFGLMYGKGVYGFSKDFNIPEEEAQVMIDNFFAGMPGVRDAIDAAHEEVKKYGCVTYMSGRKRHFKKELLTNFRTGEKYEGYSKRSLRQAFNACVQGFSADMMRLAMNSIREKAKTHPEYDIRMVATVHDEAIMTCNEKYAEKSAELVKSAMEGCVNFVVPVTADTEIVDNYGAAK